MGPTIAPQLIDVTLRDGGYLNEWKFPVPDALAIVSTLAKAGVPYIEVGYYSPRAANNGAGKGPSAWCSHEYLEAISSVGGDSKLVVMVHLDDVLPSDYTFLADHHISCVRFVISSSTIAPVERHIEAAHAAGLCASVNLIRASERTTENMLVCGHAAEDSGADWLYIADSNGSLFPDRVEKIFHALSSELGIPLGFHAHDSLHLAFANSLAAIAGGGRMLDSSLGGMGKGAGNLITELITAYLKSLYDMPFKIAELNMVTCQTLGEWIGRDRTRRCESALSALLDLNAEKLKEIVGAAEKAQRPLLVELEAGLDRVMIAQPPPAICPTVDLLAEHQDDAVAF